MSLIQTEDNAHFLMEASKMLHQACFQELAASDIKLKPHYLYKPTLSMDGDQWCALYGENLQDGVAGFGKSPEEAMEDFDKNWRKKLQ